MNKEQRIKVYAAYGKLASASIELGRVISTLPTGEEKEDLMKGGAKIRKGLGTLLVLLEVAEDYV